MPGSQAARSHPDGLLAEMESHLQAGLKDLPGVYVVVPERVSNWYSMPEYEGPHSLAIAAVPYTQEYFAALATVITRWIYHLKVPPAKVIVLDCDGTLWKGVCGEDGPRGVEIDAPRRALQEFVLAQRDAGICLHCSVRYAVSKLYT